MIPVSGLWSGGKGVKMGTLHWGGGGGGGLAKPGSYIGVSLFDYPAPETNIFAPKNGWLEDDPASYWVLVTFQGRTVELRGGG